MPLPEKLDVPEPVLAIVRRLEDAGHESWCVGGAVRDAILNEPHADFDIATAAEPLEVQRLFRRTIPVGIEHGTLIVLDDDSKPHEVTTFRRDVKTDGRHAVVEFGVEFDEDLARRDFTINAIGYHPFRNGPDAWRDPFAGIADIDRGVVRAVGDPALRFREDYLRILRATRFATRFGFEIETATWQGAIANARGLEKLSAERVRDEWFKGLSTARKPSELVLQWTELGASKIWLGRERGRGNREGLDRFAVRDPVLMTAFLFQRAGEILARLRCSSTEVGRGEAIDRYCDSKPTVHAVVEVRKWMSRVRDTVDDLVTIWEVEGDDSMLRDSVARVRSAGDALTLGDLAISGDDLRRLGIEEGPLVGKTLKALLEDVLENPCHNSKEYLTDLARRLVDD